MLASQNSVGRKRNAVVNTHMRQIRKFSRKVAAVSSSMFVLKIGFELQFLSWSLQVESRRAYTRLHRITKKSIKSAAHCLVRDRLTAVSHSLRNMALPCDRRHTCQAENLRRSRRTETTKPDAHVFQYSVVERCLHSNKRKLLRNQKSTIRAVWRTNS